MRLTMKPGPVRRDDELLAQLAGQRADRRLGSRRGRLPRISSTSGMTGTGLKKCMPANRSRRAGETASASRSIEIELVFEAKIAVRRELVELSPQLALDVEILEDGLDDEVRVRGSGEIGVASPAPASHLAPRRSAALRDGPIEVAGDPLAARLGPLEVGLVEHDRLPIAACTWAMPWPMRPAPATKTLSIDMVRPA